MFAEVRAGRRAEQGFKQLLEDTPEISHSWPWPMAKRKVHSRPSRHTTFGLDPTCSACGAAGLSNGLAGSCPIHHWRHRFIAWLLIMAVAV